HTQTGRARPDPPNLVARNPDQTHRSTQLQCNCLAASMNPPILLKMTVHLNRSGLDFRRWILPGFDFTFRLQPVVKLPAHRPALGLIDFMGALANSLLNRRQPGRLNGWHAGTLFVEFSF